MRTIPAPIALRAVVTEVRKAQATVTDPDIDQLLRAVTSIMEHVADEWDDCVQWRIEEEAALHDLLERGERLVPPELAARLAAARPAPAAPDLRVSTLDDRLDALRAAINELCAWLEENPGQETTALWRDIWRHLLAGLDRQAARPGMTAY